ncbi:MAG: FtsW/RodA/SpoVE family cell cycle protein, partial [Planctomycetota bacterium]
EELGLFGASLVPILFCLFGWAGLYAAMRCRSRFGSLAIAGVTCQIVGQATINLLVVTGMMPVTGVTLPFFSYGGSSLLGTWCALGVCAGLSAARNDRLG